MKCKKRFADYDYTNYYSSALSNSDELKLQELAKSGTAGTIYATKKIISGNQVELEIYPEFTKSEVKKYELPKSNLAQRNLNDKNARKRLCRLLNCNFTDGDYWITFTYSNEHVPKSMNEALKNMQNYIRRINYKRTKLGYEKTKYIYITEYDEEKKKRCHHHVVMDALLAMDVVEDTWTKGKRNNIRRISTDEEGLNGLAGYLSKDPKGKKRWCASTNLKKPYERKTYSYVKKVHVKRMVEGTIDIKSFTENKFQRMEYLSNEIKFNDVNGKFYIYIKMRIRQ